jgi:hypothetical protein
MLAATAAGGLPTTNIIANAQTGPFQSKPGDGEFLLRCMSFLLAPNGR